jgi:hypothetical protein
MRPSTFDRVFRVLSVVFACAAVFHAAAFVKPEIAEPMPRAFHASFVLVNLVLAYCVLRFRTKLLAGGFVIYMLQQWIEHVPRGLSIWQEQHRIDWASLSSSLFVPVVFVLLLLDLRGRSARESHVQQHNAAS